MIKSSLAIARFVSQIPTSKCIFIKLKKMEQWVFFIVGRQHDLLIEIYNEINRFSIATALKEKKRYKHQNTSTFIPMSFLIGW
jgi:ADP-heptose:LPS heptosyltransferase